VTRKIGQHNVLKTIKRTIYWFLLILFAIPFLFVGIITALYTRFTFKETNKPRLVWGSVPIINNSYWSKAMRACGFESTTYTTSYFSVINKREDWDRILEEEYKFFPSPIKPFLAFLRSLIRYDIFFISFDGFFIGSTPLYWVQIPFFRIAKKRIVVIPYGSDAYVYHRIRSTSAIHGLLMSYPQAAREQQRVARNVDYWCRYGDVMMPSMMGPDGFGRWDVLVPSSLHIDLNQWQPSSRLSQADGKSETVKVAHAPNHRGVKGTEFLISAIDQLKNEGLLVELILLERVQNSEVRRILKCEADILVEQLIFTGHGLNAVEGMASGLPVISNLEDDTYILPMRRWSFFNECPIVSASPETLAAVLRKLITRPELRHKLGRAGREYVEKYHGLDSAQYLFGEVIEYLYGRRKSLINLYHPLLGDHPKRKPKVHHPLVNNKIVD